MREPTLRRGVAASTRILIADDHDVVRRGVRAILEGRLGWEVAGEAANGAEALDLATSLKPDVAVVDYSLPIINGSQLTRRIRAVSPRTEVLIFAIHESDVR